ncbi:alpha/beta fold hydrolase [uncultured Chitinophaga sp.]|uniref:alpha/beta fold hydrolase n=1 Tax=uncultured Chitinophaga sp. TaxID=339340 RepID=UPI0026116BCF|nr:alpha/beta fold hydrolase [uncultured Chitinophaga sp.]
MKPALILLHGALGAARHFDGIAAILEDQYDVHRFNLHGHGGTPLPDSPLRIEGFTEQLIGYIRQHDLAPAAIFGFSMGGYIAMQAATQAPDSISRILTLGTKFDWTPDVAAKEARQLNAGFLRDKAPAFVSQLAEFHGPAAWEPLLPATVGLMEALGQRPLLTPETVAAVEAPVRLMVGDRDHMVSIEETLGIFRNLPNGSMVVLPDTKHPIEKVNKAVLIWEIRSFMTL